jgi:hypothetical protein
MSFSRFRIVRARHTVPTLLREMASAKNVFYMKMFLPERL